MKFVLVSTPRSNHIKCDMNDDAVENDFETGILIFFKQFPL